MNKFRYILFVVLVIAVPIIIYLYFLQWKTTTIYGDDLYIYKSHASLNDFSEKVNIPGLFRKYRPVQGWSIHFLIETFQKNLNGYYFFNIAIQVINCFLFALILNLFLRSPSLALIFSLSLGLSRFCCFNISQLLNGGTLEGLATTFFLLFLFYIIRAMVFKSDPVQKYRATITAILFANLSMYTHERYIVLLPFVVLLVLVYPGLKILSKKQKIILSLTGIFSICLNVYLKIAVYNTTFFVGTSGINIKPSSTSFTFLTEALSSIFMVNRGRKNLTGIGFGELPFFNKSLVIVLLIGFLISFFIYFRKFWKAGFASREEKPGHVWLLPFLSILFILLLVPAIVTIKLEQRWLQASYSIFILCFIIAFSHISFKNNYTKNGILSLLLALLLYCDFSYLTRGANNNIIIYSGKFANKLREAMDEGIIRPGTKKIYIWRKQQDANTENYIKWVLGKGYFFNFYQQQEKEIIFINSLYKKDIPYSGSFTGFNRTSDQIIYLDNGIIDITNDF